MKFDKLTDEQVNLAKKIYKDNSQSWDKRMRDLVDLLGASERTVRKWCVDKFGLKETPEVESEQYEEAKRRKIKTTSKVFLITSAQSNTKANVELLNNMKAYAKHRDAEILVIPFRYKNPTSIDSEIPLTDFWVDEVAPYLIASRHNLNNNLSILGNIKVQPTATNPLTSLESLTINHSSIVGHPRVHLKVLPVLDSENPKIICSTGACTISNFSDSKSGAIGSFHHTLGFVVVEIKDTEKFFLRQVTAEKNGSFIDLYYSVKNSVVTRVKESLAVIKGDIHYGNHDEKVLSRSFKELIPKVNPKNIVLHDVFDGFSINHHEEHDFIKQYQKEITNKNSLKNEINSMLDWFDTIKKYNLIVVFSNHDDFLNRFIINSDVKKNIKNAMEYVEYAKILMENKAPKGLIAYLINQKFKNVKCLGRNESCKIKDWEVGIHGMDGINGSRGSIQQYRRLNSKIITAHAHTAVRLDGALQVGTNTKLRMGYNNGISNWIHSDVLISSNGKAQHIIYVGTEREFTTMK
jgi:hypothetical protein